jgi:hypothetical protein
MNIRTWLCLAYGGAIHARRDKRERFSRDAAIVPESSPAIPVVLTDAFTITSNRAIG